MKRYILFFSLMSLFFLSSCKKEEDNVFGMDPSDRMAKTLTEIQDDLVHAPNGWILRMYPSASLKYGGYNVLLKFEKNGTVTIANELEGYTTPVSSSYIVNSNSGPCVVFDTFNQNIHVFSEPQQRSNPELPGPQPVGADGDFVLRVFSYTNQKIVFRGLRSDVEMEMVPLKEGVEWADYFKHIAAVKERFYAPSYQMTVGDSTFVGQNKKSAYNVKLRVLQWGEQDIPFVYTDQGVQFHDSVTIHGQKFNQLTEDKEGESVIFTANNRQVVYKRIAE